MIKRFGVVGLALAIAGVGFFLGRSSSDIPRAFEDACADDRVDTFNISVTPSRDVYAVGEMARFEVQVTRAIKTDEHEEGEELGPAEGVDVALNLNSGSVSLTDEALTDAEGKARIDLRLPLRARPGAADAFAVAEKETVDVECVPHEAGHFHAEELIRIVRR